MTSTDSRTNEVAVNARLVRAKDNLAKAAAEVKSLQGKGVSLQTTQNLIDQISAAYKIADIMHVEKQEAAHPIGKVEYATPLVSTEKESGEGEEVAKETHMQDLPTVDLLKMAITKMVNPILASHHVYMRSLKEGADFAGDIDAAYHELIRVHTVLARELKYQQYIELSENLVEG